MTTRPLSPTLRARPRRAAALGVWHVKVDELKGSPGLYRLVQLVMLHQVDPDVVYGLPNSESISIARLLHFSRPLVTRPIGILRTHPPRIS
jgi:hypothetical protein